MEENHVIKFTDIDSWVKFYDNLNRIDFQNRMIFRGQANKFRNAGCSSNGWRLEPSLYRLSSSSHTLFIYTLKLLLKDHYCQKLIRHIIGRNLCENDEADRLILIGLLRHLGKPTPLLDWTYDPFIAAYFAFKNISRETDKVTIFLFDYKSWQDNESAITSRDLKIITFHELDHIIPRQRSQKSIYTYCRNKNVYSEILGDEAEGNEYFIVYCELPAKEQKAAITTLMKMGVTEERLFPDERERGLEELRNLFESFF